jgi:hypothetical protein
MPTVQDKSQSGGGNQVTEPMATTARIFRQSMCARNQVGTGLSGPARQATQAYRIDSLESIFGHLKSLKIRALIR